MSDIWNFISNNDTHIAEDTASAWIQHKGTNICMDTHCVCGYHGHIDDDFVYFYECPECHRKYAVGQNIKLIELPKEFVNEDVDFKTDEEQS